MKRLSAIFISATAVMPMIAATPQQTEAQLLQHLLPQHGMNSLHIRRRQHCHGHSGIGCSEM